MISAKSVSMVIAVASLLAILPLSSRGGTTSGVAVISKTMAMPEGQTPSQAGKLMVPIVGEKNGLMLKERIRLRIAAWLPVIFQRRVHQELQYRSQSAYLQAITAEIEQSGSGLARSGLARELIMEGSEIQRAYHNYARTSPREHMTYSKRQLDFIMTMIHYIETSRSLAPEAHQANLAFFSAFIWHMKSIASVSIARMVGIENSDGQFRVPVQMLQTGHLGSLGAVLDTLKSSTYDIHPNVLQSFIRQVRILFSTSV